MLHGCRHLLKYLVNLPNAGFLRCLKGPGLRAGVACGDVAHGLSLAESMFARLWRDRPPSGSVGAGLLPRLIIVCFSRCRPFWRALKAGRFGGTHQLSWLARFPFPTAVIHISYRPAITGERKRRAFGWRR